MSARPVRSWLAHVGSACLAALVSVGMVLGIYNTLHQIEHALPRFGFFSIREINIAIQDISHLRDMVSLARLAPGQAESVERLAEANDLVYVRFARQDQSLTVPGYEEYGATVARARSVVDTVDGILAGGPPLDAGSLDGVATELAHVETDLREAYYASGNATNADLAEIQQRLGTLNVQTAVVLSALSALAIGVAVLLVNRHRTLRSFRELAWSDSLTGLKNRAWLLANIKGILRDLGASSRGLSLFLIDINRFKEVNDTFGHQAGDALLQKVGEVLAEVEARCTGHAVRLGGDEFAIFLPTSSGSVFDAVRRELVTRLDTDLEIEGVQVRMSASIGIARFPEHGADLDALLRSADYALYSAKARPGAADVLFSPDIAGHIENQLRLDAAIRHAIAFEELFLEWQPQYELTSGRLSGAEALVRWRDPTTNAVVLPGDFIPIAERSELILEIDRFVLTKACMMAAEWSAAASQDFTFSVNLSAKHLQRPELAEFVRDTLANTGLEPRRLEIEITESAFIENRDLALGVLAQLHALGVRVALDDFGTGYSSLSYLLDLDVTRIKIDRSFIADLTASTEKRSVVQAIMALAKSLHLDVVAEGVQTSEQAASLMQLECRYAQGFLLSPPISAPEMTRLLAGKEEAMPKLIERAKRMLAA